MEIFRVCPSPGVTRRGSGVPGDVLNFSSLGLEAAGGLPAPEAATARGLQSEANATLEARRQRVVGIGELEAHYNPIHDGDPCGMDPAHGSLWLAGDSCGFPVEERRNRRPGASSPVA